LVSIIGDDQGWLEKYVREGQCFYNLQGSSFAMVSANHWRGLKENNNKRNWLNFYFFGVLVIVPYPMVDTNHWKGLVNNVSFETIGCSYKVLTIEMQLVDSIQFNCFSSLPLWSTSIIGFIKIESGLLKLLNLTL
jgi:hypothetical protein